MNFQKKLFFFVMMVSFVLSCGTIGAQETNAPRWANEWLIVMPDPYEKYLEDLPLPRKIWNALGASDIAYIIRHFNDHDNVDMPNEYRLPGPSSQEFYKLAQEGQTAVGISKDRHLPVGLLDFLEKSHVIGSVGLGVMLFNEESFKEIPYGLKKLTACHEAIHVKYYSLMDKLIAFPAGYLLAMAFDQVSNQLVPLHVRLLV
jgi:hypothetical protein